MTRQKLFQFLSALKEVISMNSLKKCCEACKMSLIEVVEVSDDPYQPYQLCHHRHEWLLKHSLRPIE